VDFATENASVYRFVYQPDNDEIYPEEEYTEETVLQVYEDKNIIFGVRYGFDYVLESVTAGEDNEELESIHTYKDDEANYAVYRYQPSSDTTIAVKAVSRGKYNVTLDCENVTAYNVYQEEGAYRVSEPWEDRAVYAGNKVTFAISCANTHKLEKVSLVGSEENAVKFIESYTEDGESYYYIYTFQPTADSTIEAKAIPKENYTLKFEQGSYYISGEYFDTSSGEMEFELIEGVYSFGVVLNEEGHRIKMVTTSGDTQNPESGKLSSYYNGESYHYKVNLTQDTTITVLTEEIPQRTVQISGAGAIVENVEANGDPVEETENGYVVTDRNTLSFRVREEEGYRIERVSVAGENDYTLWPIKAEEGNNYSVLVGSDLVIQVEAVEKTTGTVTVETSNASITTDAVEDGEGNYTVYKEENFVFRVEAEEGYVVESVSANGEKLQPQYDPYGDSTYYQIMVEEDVELSVVAETPEENEVHFKGNGYNEESLAIWSASESYSPVDGTIEVTSSEEIWFDLPDNIHQIAKVTCTDINGESKTLYRTYYHGNEGYYLGNIAEEIEIEITRGTTYQLTFSGNNDEKFMPLEGLGIFPETVYVPVNEALDFKVVASAGNILTGISCKGASLKGSLKTGIYQMIPKKSSDLLVQVSSGSAWHQRCVFDHQPEDVAVSCFINGEEASLVNNAVVIPSTESFVLKVKPLNGKKVLLSYDDSETIEVTEVEEDGTYVYELNASKISGDHLKIDTYKANVVEFSGSNLQIWVGEFNEDGYLSWTEAGNSISVKENKTLLFRVIAEGGYKVSDVTVEDKTAGELATKNYYDEYTGMTVSYYSIKPEKDTTINVITEEIPAHNYQFIFDESKVELYIGTYSYYYDEWDYDFEWEEGGKEYRKQVVNGKYNDVLFRVVPKEGYKVSLVSTTEDESGKLSVVRDEGRDVSYYVLQNIGDATITIVAEEIVDYNVTFEWDEGIRFVEISNRGEIQNHETISVSNTELIRIFTAPKRMELPSSEEVDMYHLVSATANGKVLEKFYDADESGYYYYKLSNLKEDTTVVIETEYNPDVINRLYFTTGEEETLYNAFYYKETEDEEGNVDSEKVYLDLEDTFPVFGRNQLIGIEPEDGYGIIKVEFYRNGKATTLSPNEDGLYNIFYPFSMGMEGTIVVSTFKLKTMAENVVVENVANGKLTQYADTVKDYHLVFTPEDADITQMGVEVIAAEGQQADVVSAEIVDRKLRVTTKAVTNKEEAATVKFYDIDAKTGEKVYVDGGTFTVSTAKQAIFAEGAVKAEVKKADDATLTMELTAPEGLAELNEGAYYYKVVVTPQAGEGQEIPEEIRNATENPFYIAVEEEAQEVQLLLNANGVGKGQAWTYDIAVALVQTKNRDGLDYITATEKVIFESPLHTLEPVTTKNPYYQDKVVLQDQVKQMYTVQGELAVAKVVFDENNSDPRVSQVTDITELDGKGSALTVWEENGIIYANAGTDTLIGKHTIEVTLAAPEYMNKTKGTFVVTVIKGIENMTVTVPSAEIYKESKKTASVKAEITYNEGTEAPKTKKVIWEVVKPNGEAFAAGDALYGVLSMSNGKVTVNKSF
ncbi:MAG: hypothetical protein IKW28_05895, partial [Lachnospiraceae bacterium]|nr:hypothetical protein [Lachnospiraceae bacterium]